MMTDRGLTQQLSALHSMQASSGDIDPPEMHQVSQLLLRKCQQPLQTNLYQHKCTWMQVVDGGDNISNSGWWPDCCQLVGAVMERTSRSHQGATKVQTTA